MPVTHTNRKEQTYVLCQGTTKTGKPRYFFAREPKGEVLDRVPEGYQIEASVNGDVSLAKQRPQPIAAGELAAVEAALQRHPKRRNFAARAQGKHIVIYEREGLDIGALSARFGHLGPVPTSAVEALEETQPYLPIMRFIRLDPQTRRFAAKRWHFGGIGAWLDLGRSGEIKTLARQRVPTLGTDAFFELG
jgi:hypothetical protein